jgi:riboflavin kinase / FMN adenylyltransferase
MYERMKFIRGIMNVSSQPSGFVATIGNFDGVHRGHQYLLEQVKQQAQLLHLPTMLITFEPHPQDYFSKDKSRPRLTRLREKYRIVQQLGIDYFVCLPFNARLAQLSATDFIETILVNKLNIKCIVIGDDFRFGKDRKGDYFLLAEAGKHYGFSVIPSHTIEHEAKRISSQRVREALSLGQLDTVAQLLARPYSMVGKVVRGDQRGRAIGFPTANIHLAGNSAPLSGVFAVRVKMNRRVNELVGGMRSVAEMEVKKGDIGVIKQNESTPLFGVANLGTRPTVDGTRFMLEVHLFDYAKEFYGQYIEVEFLKKIRDEKRFDNIEALKAQIALDVNEAKQWIAN